MDTIKIDIMQEIILIKCKFLFRQQLQIKIKNHLILICFPKIVATSKLLITIIILKRHTVKERIMAKSY